MEKSAYICNGIVLTLFEQISNSISDELITVIDFNVMISKGIHHLILFERSFLVKNKYLIILVCNIKTLVFFMRK